MNEIKNMRDYLYIWHNREERCIVASGIESKDIFTTIVEKSGIILLSHHSEHVLSDATSRLEFVPYAEIPCLIQEDIYSWGNFCWVDYTNEDFPRMSKHEVAELLYFDHMAEPLADIRVPSLHNKFMAYAHDDGWFLKLYYVQWHEITSLIERLDISCDRQELIAQLEGAEDAYWVSGDALEVEEVTFNIDGVLNKKLRERTAKG